MRQPLNWIGHNKWRFRRKEEKDSPRQINDICRGDLSEQSFDRLKEGGQLFLNGQTNGIQGGPYGHGKCFVKSIWWAATVADLLMHWKVAYPNLAIRATLYVGGILGMSLRKV